VSQAGDGRGEIINAMEEILVFPRRSCCCRQRFGVQRGAHGVTVLELFIGFHKVLE
jgi:hypothetical protein